MTTELASDAGTFTRLQRATRVFGKENPRRADHLAFLFTAFNVWKDRDVTATFAGLFDVSSADARQRRLPLFFRDPNINLFEAACRNYGDMGGGGNRIFTFGQTLLLYAVVLHLAGETNDFRERLRALRNLVEGSQFEMRAERMPRLVADTRELIENGTLPEPGNTFAVAQISDETEKRAVPGRAPRASRGAAGHGGPRPPQGLDHRFCTGRRRRLEPRWATFDELMAAPESVVGRHRRAADPRGVPVAPPDGTARSPTPSRSSSGRGTRSTATPGARSWSDVRARTRSPEPRCSGFSSTRFRAPQTLSA